MKDKDNMIKNLLIVQSVAIVCLAVCLSFSAIKIASYTGEGIESSKVLAQAIKGTEDSDESGDSAVTGMIAHYEKIEDDQYTQVYQTLADGVNEWQTNNYYIQINEGSDDEYHTTLIYNTKGESVINMAYDKEMSEGIFIENCVSRKKNVVPLIRDALEN